jgi:DNA-binding MarR family transcriptional regulator
MRKGNADREPTTADRLHSLAIHLLRYARVEDVATGMSATRLSVLSVLVFGGPRTVTQLAEAEQVATPTMTRLLQALEAEGYIRRRRDERDGRIVRVRATARGARVLQSGRRTRVRRVAKVVAVLSPERQALVAQAVEVLTAALHQVVEAERG